jgi:hypothetical protein
LTRRIIPYSSSRDWEEEATFWGAELEDADSHLFSHLHTHHDPLPWLSRMPTDLLQLHKLEINEHGNNQEDESTLVE